MNTAEVITGEICGTAAFLGLTVGYTWLYLRYAEKGVLKFGKPVQRGQKKQDGEDTSTASGPVPVKAA